MRPPVTSPAVFTDGAFAVAPMMDYTNRFLRFLLRRLSKRATLYSEMVVSNTIVYCDPSELPRYLEYGDPEEHPVVLQIGGADPALLRRATSVAAPFRYDAINLNCGCPSDRVAERGCFGAALMREPELVARCCDAMAQGAPETPITVKCRIGVVDSAHEAITADEERLYDDLAQFVSTVSASGVRHFAVHARQAVLGGLSPAANRKVPPLRYGVVRRLAAEFPHLSISINGGIESVSDARQLLYGTGGGVGGDGGVVGGAGGGGGTAGGGGGVGDFSGVMVGRAVVARPWDWAVLDSQLYGDPDPALNRMQVLEEYCAFIDAWEAAHPKLRMRGILTNPVLTLFAGDPFGKKFRAAMNDRAKLGLSVRDLVMGCATDTLLEETLLSPPGDVWDMHEKRYVTPQTHTHDDGHAAAAATTDTTATATGGGGGGGGGIDAGVQLSQSSGAA